MAVKPFWLINKTEREALTGFVRRGLEAWQREWFGMSVSMAVAIESDASVSGGRHRGWKVYRVDRAELSLSLPVNWEHATRAWLTGNTSDEAASDEAAKASGWIAPIVNEQLTRSLVATLLSEANIFSAQSPVVDVTQTKKPAADMGSGEVVVQCTFAGSVKLWLLLPADVVSACLSGIADTPTAVSLSPVLDAMAGRQVSLDVMAGEAELTLAELRTLGVGDVIRLDRSVYDPLPIRLSGGEPICAGHLGAQGDRKAVQLIAIDESFTRG